MSGLHFYVEEHRAKLMANPDRYIELLRRQNELHCVWHTELQERIGILEKSARDVAALLESYRDPETASATKLRRYAQQLKEVLDV